MTTCSSCKHNQGDAGKEVSVPAKTYPQASLEEILKSDAPFIKVAGAAGTGKTEYLVRKAASLVQAGVAPTAICVVVNSADAKISFEARLKALTPEAPVKVTTIVGVCREILSTPQAQEATGRAPRLLNNAEYKFLLEDMKTLGMQPSRLRKMLNYFYYQWSQLKPEEEWLLPREENGVRRAFDTFLRNRDAMVREELAPVTANYLLKHREDVALFDYVLVDDYQNLSKASQITCENLSTHATIVTGNENQLIEGIDPYPFKEGFTCFEYHQEKTECFQLSQSLRSSAAISAIGTALCKHGEQFPGYEAPSENAANLKDITQIKWGVPEEEFKGLPFVVRNILKADPSLNPSDIYLVVPHKKWAQVLSRNLSVLGIESSVGLDAQVLAGDPRDLDKAGALVAYTKLNLAADPRDLVAWRSWCGFGNYLCYSGAWSRLEEWAKEENLDLLTALETLSTRTDEPFLEASVLKERWTTGQEAIKALAGKTGFALTNTLVAESGQSGLTTLLEAVNGDETPLELFTYVHERILEPVFAPEAKKIRIGSYRRLQGLTPRVVVISALVDGFMPSRNSFDVALLEKDREKEKSACRKLFYNAVTKPSDALVLSTLQKADLEIAELMKMEVRRVRMDQGKRYAMLSPSLFIDETGDAIPSAVSGQQYLGEL